MDGFQRMAQHPFTATVIEIIRNIPEGRVATYGGIAAMAGNPRAARQVARILHACSQREELPWHRVVNREGRIALKPFQGHDDQKRLLEREGIEFDGTGALDLALFLWTPGVGP
jgi:methylated-DNA-protein-cysteine methyltransferase-like protein